MKYFYTIYHLGKLGDDLASTSRKINFHCGEGYELVSTYVDSTTIEGVFRRKIKK